jgi:hypothetical protein
MDWQAIGMRAAPILTAVFGLGAVAGLYAVSRSRRTARATRFGFVRERSDARAKRLLILTIVLVVLAAASSALWVVSARRPGLLPRAEPTVTLTLIPSPTPRTPTATLPPTDTPTVTITPTETPLPPDADLPAVVRAPLPTQAVTPGPDAKLVELVLASGMQDDSPVGASTQFAKGTARVYAFFTFDGMSRDVPWSHVWYSQVGGELVESWSAAELWPYDSAHGRVWRYFEPRAGYYELHVYVGRRLQLKVPFTVEGE